MNTWTSRAALNKFTVAQLIAFSARAGGLLARSVQHKVDHLNGILFIDRMTSTKKKELPPELGLLMAETKAALAKNK